MLAITSSIRMGKGACLALLVVLALTGCENRGNSAAKKADSSSEQKAQSDPEASKSGPVKTAIGDYKRPADEVFESLSYDQALAKARAEDRMLLIFVHLDNCTQCEVFEEETLGAASAMAWLKKNVIAIKTKDYTENRRYSELYGNAGESLAVPTVLLLRGNGDLIARIAQNMNTREISLERFLEEAQAAADRLH